MVDGRVEMAHLLDISEHGAKLGFAPPRTVGTELTLIGADHRVPAAVRWTRNDTMGVKFIEKLDAATQEDLSRRPWRF